MFRWRWNCKSCGSGHVEENANYYNTCRGCEGKLCKECIKIDPKNKCNIYCPECFKWTVLRECMNYM